MCGASAGATSQGGERCASVHLGNEEHVGAATLLTAAGISTWTPPRSVTVRVDAADCSVAVEVAEYLETDGYCPAFMRLKLVERGKDGHIGVLGVVDFCAYEDSCEALLCAMTRCKAMSGRGERKIVEWKVV